MLNDLDPNEWKSLEKYISIYHSVESMPFQTFIYLKENKCKLLEIGNSEDIQKTIFPDSTPKTFINLYSNLFQIAEEWLLAYEINKGKKEKYLRLNQIYNERGLYKFADQKEKKLLSLLNKGKGYSFQKHKFKTELLHQTYYSDNPQKYQKGSKMLNDLTSSFFDLTIIQSLLFRVELHNWAKLTQQDLDVQKQLLEDLIQISPHNVVYDALIDLKKVVLEEDVEAFINLREKIYRKEFDPKSKLHEWLVIYLLNSAIQLWHKNLYVDGSENAKLIEYGLKTGALTKSGKIPLQRFHNLISTLGTLKDYEWNIQFIEKWKDNVQTENIASTESLARAQIAFIFEKYDEILEFIRDVEFEVYGQKILALGLELIGLYHDRDNSYATLRSFISNFKRTLKRNRLKSSDAYYKSNLNLIKVVEKLMIRDFKKVTIRPENYDHLLYRKWVDKMLEKKGLHT